MIPPLWIVYTVVQRRQLDIFRLKVPIQSLAKHRPIPLKVTNSSKNLTIVYTAASPKTPLFEAEGTICNKLNTYNIQITPKHRTSVLHTHTQSLYLLIKTQPRITSFPHHHPRTISTYDNSRHYFNRPQPPHTDISELQSKLSGQWQYLLLK